MNQSVSIRVPIKPATLTTELLDCGYETLGSISYREMGSMTVRTTLGNVGSAEAISGAG